jgi:hypothetical protein
MKKLPIAFIFLAGILFFACRKEDNPKIPDLARVPAILVKLDATSDKFISPVAPAGFKGKFTVDLLFPNEKPQSVDVVVMRNNDPLDVKVVKAEVSTFPATVEVTGQQLITLFGKPITGGDSFTFGVNVNTTEGNTFVAFPTAGANAYSASATNTAINVSPGATTQVQFLMPCPFNADAYAGTFIVQTDEWNDYKKGAEVEVKKVSATQISFEYAVDAGTAQPIILTINPTDNSISVTKQVYGSYGSDVFSAESVAGAFSAVNPCDVSLSVRLKHTTTGYANSFTIILKKK